MGGAIVGIAPSTSIEILDLDDDLAQAELTQGTINVRIGRLYSGQHYEVATPTLAFTIKTALVLDVGG